jgi:pimeloyl-ACP methyl ester carboxylesterase
MIRPFKVNIPSSRLKEIIAKVENYPWSLMPNMKNWEHGTNKNYLKELCDYWIKNFKWKKYEKLINNFTNFKTTVEDIEIHFIQEKGSGPNPKPLLLMHGWPGSIVEFLEIIKPLAHPENYGGKAEDAFTVIVPSLPGFGFSSSPKIPIGPRKIAKILDKMMTENLNFKNYVAQGGDWGATIANWLGYDHSNNCRAIHINCLTMRHPDGPQSNEEKKWQEKFNKEQMMQDGYRTQQSTKPQTLSYAMMDSPVGIAAWILEKMHGWSDLNAGDIESVYSKDILLANIMIYILTNTFNSASWIYFGRREEGGRYFPKKFKKIKVPTGIIVFPQEMSKWPPRSYVNRIFNVKQWNEIDSGGHFAALEKPEIFLNDIRNFFKNIQII